LLLSLLNIPHAATGLNSGEAERGEKPPHPQGGPELPHMSRVLDLVPSGFWSVVQPN
jgi:hypothetical protein